MAIPERLTRADQAVPERSTWVYTRTLTDERGTVLTSSAITTLALTLYDTQTNGLINLIDHVNIKNTGRGTVNSSGLLTVTLAPADTIMLVTTHRYEQRRMLIQWTYTGGAKAQSHEVELLIRRVLRYAV